MKAPTLSLMQALKPALCRQARRATTNSAAHKFLTPTLALRSQQFRFQHDQHGPHKEYFQTPGQMPVPDTAPYAHGQPYPQGQPYLPKTEPAKPVRSSRAGPSLFVRFARSVLWVIIFYPLGAAAGIGLITWEYLQPPFEPGSEMEQDLLDEIADAIELHPLVDSLRQANWIEDDYYADHNTRINELGTKGMHFVAEKLQGVQGITLRTFKHPTQEFTMLVAFLGFGVEGWPDVIHGGIITTLVQESLERQIHNFYGKYGKQHAQAISIDFKKRMRPGEVYAIIVPPAEVEMNPPQKEVMHLQMLPLVVRIDAPPRIRARSFDARAERRGGITCCRECSGEAGARCWAREDGRAGSGLLEPENREQVRLDPPPAPA